MIEVVSSLADPEKWDVKEQPFYLEVYGETSPTVDEAYAEVVPAGSDDQKRTADAPVYEYWWTLGHPGAPEHHRHWLEPEISDRRPWQEVADPAARVYLYFPVSAGWRAVEVTATLKYLSPVPEQHDWFRTAVQDFQAVQPIAGGLSSAAGLVPGGAEASKWLDVVAKLQVSSLPQSGNLKWSVEKVTFGSPNGVMQGVVWTIPRAVFQRLGGRLTGSLAVSFISAHHQDSESDEGKARASYGQGNVLAHAVVYGADNKHWWSPVGDGEGRGFIHLSLSPRSPNNDNVLDSK